MSTLIKLLLLIGVFYGHSRFVFSENHLQKWVVDFSAKAMSGDQAACDLFTDNAEVSIYAPNNQGHWEVEGGKAEACGYMRQGAAAFTLLQARTNSNFDNFQIERSGFPWLTATVSYTEHATISGKLMPKFTTVSEDSLVITRTLSGLRIKKLDSQGEMADADDST